MAGTKSLEYSEVFSALVRSVQTLHCEVYTTLELERDLKTVTDRLSKEGIGFLTKTLPRLGKSLDRALANQAPMDAVSLRCEAQEGSKLPKLFGSLFQQVLAKDGTLLPEAQSNIVESLRQLLFVFYKLELPYDPKLEQDVIDQFLQTERDIEPYHRDFSACADRLDSSSTLLRCITAGTTYRSSANQRTDPHGVILPEMEGHSVWFRRTTREARELLNKLFSRFDHLDIYPRHGPGSVSTKETLWDKYRWTRYSKRITQTYPLDSYYYTSPGHVCDSLAEIIQLKEEESYAKVVLVPKDSRGPRLISEEPLEFQWIQQGLSQAIVRHVESHPLTRESVRFTDQEPNRMAAKYGSLSGRYATLDLKEASDRITIGLVRLLFPEPLLGALMNTRSLGTQLPNGDRIKLQKFAPMGSALCFPTLALTVWSLLTAGLRVLDPDNGSNAVIYVYGDDVIVSAAYAEHAMIILESFGLKINRDKSCTSGSFRESCGMDAFKGSCVTPLRIKKLWSSSPRPESFMAWLQYARSLYERKYFGCYEYIVGWLIRTYGPIPPDSLGLNRAISLPEVPEQPTLRRRVNTSLQRLEYLVCDVKSVTVRKELSGWQMLLRYFAEGCHSDVSLKTFTLKQVKAQNEAHSSTEEISVVSELEDTSSVRAYTKRRAMKMVRRWR